MRDSFGKWARRLLWLPIVSLLALAGLFAADYVYFRLQTPPEFRAANWSGHWRTEQFNGFAGRLLVRLPDPLPEGQEFKAEAVAYYPIYCGYRTGQFVRMEFIGRLTPDEPVSAGRNQNQLPGGGKLKFKFEGEDGQVIEYTALVNPYRRRIVGGYLSRSPYDYGTFALYRE